MPPGIGYSFSPSGDVPMNNRGRSGGPSFGPQEAIRMLSLRLPQSPGPSAIAPSELMNSQGGAGIPNQVLQALMRMFAPQHQPGVPSLSTPSQPGPSFNQQASYQPQAPSQQRPRQSIPLPRIIPGDLPQAPRQIDNVASFIPGLPGGGSREEVFNGREELLSAPPPQAIDNGLFDDDARGPIFGRMPFNRRGGFDFNSLF